MKRLYAAALLFCFAATPALAALAVGDKAPDFSTLATKGGKQFSFALADALKKGPVVLYFYPAAFTKGCTIEAHEFAEATDKFAAQKATVIGVSRDNIEKLDKFSVEACRDKFPVAADPDGTTTKAYDAVLKAKPEYASRISYVIAPDHTIIFALETMDPYQHVKDTLDAVTRYRDGDKVPATKPAIP
jgi:peroxiredoxin